MIKLVEPLRMFQIEKPEPIPQAVARSPRLRRCYATRETPNSTSQLCNGLILQHIIPILKKPLYHFLSNNLKEHCT